MSVCASSLVHPTQVEAAMVTHSDLSALHALDLGKITSLGSMPCQRRKNG